MVVFKNLTYRLFLSVCTNTIGQSLDRNATLAWNWLNWFVNTLSVNPKKWSNTLKQFVGKLFECVWPWKYNSTGNTISFFVSKISFIFLMNPIDSTNDQNICVELFKATFTHQRSNCALKKKLETALSPLLY